MRPGDYADNAWRFGLFCRAALEALRTDGRPVDVLHLHDWHTGPAAIFRDARYADDPIVGRAAILTTIHNLAYHGWTPAARCRSSGWRPATASCPADADGVDLLRSAIERAELVNTVSPGFAVEARTPAFGMGLDATLREMGDRFIGILNGLDTTVWDPATDADLAAALFARRTSSGKAACRADLLARVGFDPGRPGPVIGMIGRLDPQKGFDLLSDATPSLMERGVRVIVQGSGDPALAGPFRALAAANPTRVALIERFDRAMARRIYAGRGLLRHAVAVRAVRAGPDDRPALRHAADRPPHRRAGRHGDR